MEGIGNGNGKRYNEPEGKRIILAKTTAETAPEAPTAL
jgi:hypothetical protein